VVGVDQLVVKPAVERVVHDQLAAAGVSSVQVRYAAGIVKCLARDPA
jgi:hypothetical protein